MKPETSFSRRRALQLGALTAGLPALSSVLAACGGGGDASGAVKFSGWDYESALVQANVDRFVQLHPDVPVEYTPITSAQYVQKTVAEFTAGGGPDALYVYDDSLAGWVAAEYLQPLDGMPGVDEVYAGIYPSNAEAMTIDGKRYGLPYYTDTQCLIYNEEILAQAGIAAPPTSLDELEQQSQRIKDAGILEFPIGLTAQLQDTWQAWVWGLVYAAGGSMFDEAANPVMENDAAVREVFGWLHRAATVSRVIDPAVLQLLPVPLDDAMKAGRYAFTIGARYALRDYNDPSRSQSAGKLKIAYIPSLDGTVAGTVSTTRMYALSKDTEVPEKAFTLLTYLGGYTDGVPYTAKYWFEKKGLGFPFTALEQDPEVQAGLATFADPEIYSGLAELARPRTAIKHPWYSEYENEQQKTVQQLLSDQTSPDDAVRSLSAAVASLKQKYS
ncbi:sugar ABC transporter substrate-binding protein [Pseudonocardia zijingensis]|uniref:Extracellular solute-binding protein n=1 Tax=Pseudonocardia zijingensis TaxID=153376 RepID=A0ABN1NDI8_9PSEU